MASVLKDDGTMGLMVYGKYGRTGVYQMQELLRLVTGQQHDPEHKLDSARRLYKSLPNTNWYRRGAELFQTEKDDAELFDMFLHAQDRAYSVPELYEFLDEADLDLAGFPVDHRHLYNPAIVVHDPELLTSIRERPARQQHAIAEVAGGTITKHTFWARKRGRAFLAPKTTIDPLSPRSLFSP